MKVSNCCGSYGMQIISVPEIIQAKDAGICGKCGEHCEYVEEGDRFEDRGGTGHGDISYSDADHGL